MLLETFKAIGRYFLIVITFFVLWAVVTYTVKYVIAVYKTKAPWRWPVSILISIMCVCAIMIVFYIVYLLWF